MSSNPIACRTHAPPDPTQTETQWHAIQPILSIEGLLRHGFIMSADIGTCVRGRAAGPNAGAWLWAAPRQM
jgi:hypothetical protein